MVIGWLIIFDGCTNTSQNVLLTRSLILLEKWGGVKIFISSMLCTSMTGGSEMLSMGGAGGPKMVTIPRTPMFSRPPFPPVVQLCCNFIKFLDTSHS